MQEAKGNVTDVTRRRFATTIFSAIQRFITVATLFPIVATLIQHSNAKNRRYESSSATFPLDWQNNSSARASRFFVHFFTVTSRLQREDV